MAETKTKFSKDQIKVYGEIHNLFPLNVEAMIAHMMRLEGMIQELAILNTVDINPNIEVRREECEHEKA